MAVPCTFKADGKVVQPPSLAHRTSLQAAFSAQLLPPPLPFPPPPPALQVLSYHFVPGVALPVGKMYDGQSLPTLLTANSTVHTYAASMLKVGRGLCRWGSLPGEALAARPAAGASAHCSACRLAPAPALETYLET